MVKCPFAGYKGIWEFSEWLLLFLASNVYGSGFLTSRIGCFNPGYMSLLTHWIRRWDGSQRRLGSYVEKSRSLPRPNMELCLYGGRGYDLDQGCEPVERGFHWFPSILFLFFQATSLHTEEYMYIQDDHKKAPWFQVVIESKLTGIFL
jgi:hypothetical protein